MTDKSHLWFAVTTTVILVAVIVGSAFFSPRVFTNTVSGGCKEGAKEALSLLKDWAVWMASIQTATVAALGLLAKESTSTLKLNSFEVRLTILVALFNTVALFFSAWLLTSLSSLMLRVYKDGLANYDFYNFTLYAYMEQCPVMQPLTVGFFAFWNHWLWAIGILLFGVLSISMIVRRL